MSLDFPAIDKVEVALFGDQYGLKRTAMWRAIGFHRLLLATGANEPLASAIAGMLWRISLLEIKATKSSFSSFF
jgi:hypothetical protein